jgi:hypothetical protein
MFIKFIVYAFIVFCAGQIRIIIKSFRNETEEEAYSETRMLLVDKFENAIVKLENPQT